MNYRKHGFAIAVHSNYHVCKKPIELICHKYNINTDKEIRSKHIIEKIMLSHRENRRAHIKK